MKCARKVSCSQGNALGMCSFWTAQVSQAPTETFQSWKGQGRKFQEWCRKCFLPGLDTTEVGMTLKYSLSLSCSLPRTKLVFAEWLQLPGCGGRRSLLESGRNVSAGCWVLSGQRTLILARWACEYWTQSYPLLNELYQLVISRDHF